MADYKKIVSIIRAKRKGYSFNYGSNMLARCDIGTSNMPIVGIKNKNTSYGITWDEFQSYSKEFFYEPSCDNFKNMPKSIYNLIFKKKHWDYIQGDKIKNQGIANILSELHGLGFGVVGIALSKFGYLRPYKSGTLAENVSNYFRLNDDDINFINQLEREGKSNLLFEELKKEKDIVYWVSKPYVLTTSEKLALGTSILFIGYLVYKIIKK